MGNRVSNVFSKGDFVESTTRPFDIRGYVVDYIFIDGFQCVALADDKSMNDGEWAYSTGLRKAYEKKRIMQ